MSTRPTPFDPARSPGRQLTRRGLLGRAAAAGLLAGPAAGLLAACASSGEASSEAAEGSDDNPFGFDPASQIDAVFFTGGFGEEYPDAISDAFAAHYPEAELGALKTETIGTVVQPRFAGGTPPDMVNNSGGDELDLAGLVNDGAVLDLTPLLDAPSLDDPQVPVRDTLQPGTAEAGMFGDRMFALNYSYSTYGIWYDAALFRTHGWAPPTTWDEFLELAAEMSDAGIAPFIHTGEHPWYIHNVFMEWIYREGGLPVIAAIDNLEPDAWRADAVVLAAQRLQELVDRRLVYPGAEGLDHTQSQQVWLDHGAGLIWNGSWLENEMRDTTPPEFEMTFAPPWAPSNSPATPYGTMRVGAGEPFVVPADGANTAGGLELLRVMLSRAAASAFTELTSSMTVVAGATGGVDSTALTSATEAASAAPEVMDWKALGWYGAHLMDDALLPEIADLMAGRSDAERLIDRIQQAADQVAEDDSIEKFTRDA
ncbi:N-acetylglucosamine/diacetylchitobiose ABC transporter substrate-binding protein [Natronosporangium hydrolyticum]|uniref:N-acetylglucosamine/diacetylchitobiose ABC transporter substrate-binding protein n=1 Tax=Natronosporangium hydrolyticum TaxID=2811111 RepID=A0A895YKS2_9ACTN|nr:N-acetylglucosamine/diacetylchitobiose ABC transporter substrate-binding protein [Natronosporangium hydrolyticum]QSB16099.1 N-acetylglucosamine/diacetylchitobiose ABC transporter substrate-binding protein [Natronosporangium hydrolyticum]